MEVVLTVSQTGDDSSEEEYSFVDRDSITIGRDTSADLTLHDTDTVVSRFHARLNRDGETYSLTDLGSRNGTVYKGNRLRPDEPNLLDDGDTFVVAKYEVTFHRVQVEQPTGVETVLQMNPFLLPAEELLNAVKNIQAAFDKSSNPRKEADLSAAFSDVLPLMAKQEAFVRLVRESREFVDLPGVPDGASTGSDTGQQPESKTGSPAPPAVTPEPGQEPEPREPISAPRIEIPDRSRPRIDRVLDVVLPYLSRQVKVPWQFKLEFIGHTFVPSSDTKGLYQSDAEGFAAYLFGADLDQSEFDEHLERLQRALDDVMNHQMALLDGYRESVKTGTKAMIEELDPRRLEEEVLEKQSYLKYARFLAPFFAWPRLLARYVDLENEDLSVLERRTYRPAFIKSYLENMNT